MALRTLTAGTSEALIPESRVEDGVLELIDGQEAFLTTDKDASPKAGDRITPGDSLRVEAQEGVAEILNAVGADATYQFRREDASSGANVRRITKKKGGEAVSRPIARATNVSPGANTDIFSSDVEPPETGTFNVTIVLASAAVVNVQFDQDGTTWSGDLNNGNSIGADEVHAYAVPVRGDTTYNFHVESNVTVDQLQLDYTREVK